MTATRTRTTLTEIERIRLRHLVADNAGTWYGGPLGLSRPDTVRYTAEAVVERQFPDVTYNTLWDAISDVLDQHSGILERRLSDADRRIAAAARQEAAGAWLHLAGEALEAADFPLAAAFVDQAERENPPGNSTVLPNRYEIAREVISGTAEQWSTATGNGD